MKVGKPKVGNLGRRAITRAESELLELPRSVSITNEDGVIIFWKKCVTGVGHFPCFKEHQGALERKLMKFWES